MLNYIWPWAELRRTKKSLREAQEENNRLRNDNLKLNWEVANSKTREAALREQMRLLVKNDSRDKRGRFTKVKE